MMNTTQPLRTLTVAAVLTLLTFGTAALAAPQDYRFEPVQAKIKASGSAPVAVRLVHVPTGKPVPDAIVIQQKIEMLMQGMSPMPGQVSGLKPDGQGNYAGTADLAMAGDWALNLAAKVPGETETVRGTVRLKAEK